MEMISHVELKTKRGERTYVFNIPGNAPWGELFDASFEIHKKVSEMVNEAVKNSIAQEAAPAGDAPKD
jgi:hypothetical protein